LTKRYSDVLFEVQIDDEAAFIYVLYEHKSKPEKWTLLQVLDNMVRAWRTFLRERGKTPTDRLPVILPVILHHGNGGWTAARRFSEYFGKVQKALLPYLVDFGILLDDVGKVHPDELLRRPLTAEAKLVLLCLLLGRTPQRFFVELPKWHATLREVWCRHDENELGFSVMIVYMNKVGHVPEEETVMALQQTLKLSPADQVYFADKVLRERAMRKGEIKGKIEGKQELILTQLAERFGPLPARVRATVKKATSAELERMGLRILRAATVEEVLGK